MNTDPNVALQLHEVALAIGKVVVPFYFLVLAVLCTIRVTYTQEIAGWLKEINNAIRFGYGQKK